METGTIPSLSYKDWGERLKNEVQGGRVPLSGTLELTVRCNLKCGHCYITQCTFDSEQKELSYGEICHILDEIAEAGCLWLLLTGGEPLVRKDFLDIYAYAKKKGFVLCIFTNGTLVTPELASYLKEWRPRSVEITLYGMTKDTYERFTGVPGSFERCIRGIELLAEKRVPLALKTVVSTINRHQVWQMRDYAQRLGAHFRYDPVIWPSLEGGHQPLRLRLEPEEIVRLELEDEERVKAWREFGQRKWGAMNTDCLYACNAGLKGFFIDSFGRLSLCVSTRSPSYDLRRGTFAEAWDGFLPQVRARRASRDFPCLHCDLVSICGRCAPLAEAETGAPDSEVPFLCKLAHLRVEAFGIKKPGDGASQTPSSASDSSEVKGGEGFDDFCPERLPGTAGVEAGTEAF